MDFLSWLQVLTICVLGAMSPGPSLAVVLRNTLSGGKKQGVLTGVGHGLGIYFYAGLVVTGMAVALAAAPAVERWITNAGLLLLLWLGFSFLRAKPSSEQPAEEPPSGHGAFVSGFLIAFLNPKIAAFFLAVFAPFLRAEAGLMEKTILVMTAGTIDTLWYVLVALAFSRSSVAAVLDRHAVAIERIIGAFLLFLAAGLLYRIW